MGSFPKINIWAYSAYFLELLGIYMCKFNVFRSYRYHTSITSKTTYPLTVLKTSLLVLFALFQYSMVEYWSTKGNKFVYYTQ